MGDGVADFCDEFLTVEAVDEGRFVVVHSG